LHKCREQDLEAEYIILFENALARQKSVLTC